MKPKLVLKIFSYLILVALFAACSKLNEPVQPTPTISTHNPGITDTSSVGFHSNLVVEAPNGMFDCQQCHAADWSGGITGVGCNTTECHPAINVHQEGITDPTSPNFHSKYMANNQFGLDECSECHGIDFSGGVASPSCLDCHPALDVHLDGIIDPASEQFHGNYIRQHGWGMMECQSCHSEDYSGGLISPTCLTCHSQTEGPEACNTCHGDFNDPSIIAPPQDTQNNTSTDFVGVGAHVAHLYQNDLGKQIPCSTCHIVPQNYADPGHVIDDPLPAEVVFSPLAIHNVANNPTYDYATSTCSDTYCHGNWEFLKDSADVVKQFAYLSDKMVGNNNQVVWNDVGVGQADCGTCHNLPPTDHLDHPACDGCHPGVVDADRNIIDPEKHVDGEKNVFGN